MWRGDFMLRTVKGVNNFIVYCHTNTITGQQYIGQTNQTLEERVGDCGLGYSNQYLGHIIREYGWRHFTSEILKENLTQDEANYWERYYIKERNTLYPNGLNRNTGGQNGRRVNRYTFDGTLIATYPTASAANESLREEFGYFNVNYVSTTLIRTFCQKKFIPWNKLCDVNYYWVFDDEDIGTFPCYTPSKVFDNRFEAHKDLMEYKYQLYEQSKYYDYPKSFHIGNLDEDRVTKEELFNLCC